MKTVLEYEKKSEEFLFKRIINTFQQYSKEKGEKLEQAFKFGKKVHEGQKRESGAPYFTHPLSVALILLPYRPDQTILISTILHDIFEESGDSEIRKKVSEEFGEKVEKIIEGISKVSGPDVKNISHQERQETIRKIFRFAKEDARIILIKMADRLHNIITLEGKKNEEKRKRKAQETLDIFVPIAQRMGMWDFKSLMEEICFYHLSPINYRLMREAVMKSEPKVLKLFEKIQTDIIKNTNKNEVLKIAKRRLNLFNIFEHFSEEKSVQMEDTFFIEIVVQSRERAYSLLGKLSEIYPGKRETLKDFIASPKDNGYKAIHTTAIVEGLHPVRFHIVAKDDQETNRKGIILEFLHAKKNKVFPKILEVIDKGTKQESQRFIHALQKDILGDKIVIHHKENEQDYLPSNATALDAVMIIYGEKGLKTEDIYINGEKTKFDYLLRDNDVVKPIFSKHIKANFDWIYHLNTEGARIKLQNYLKKKTKNYKIFLGKKLLQAEFDRHKRGEVCEAFGENKEALEKLQVQNIEEIFVLIAEGVLLPYEVHTIVFEKKMLHKRLKDMTMDITMEGHEGNRRSLTDMLTELYKKFHIKQLKSALMYAEAGFFKAKIKIQANEQKNLYRFYFELENQTEISKITHLLSRRKIIKAMGIFFINLSTWIVLFFLIFKPEILRQFKNYAYLFIIPVLIANVLFYRFASNYFPKVRNSVLLVLGIFAINAIAISIYSAMLLVQKLDILHFSFFFPLTILVLSSLTIAYVFSQRHALKTMPLTIKLSKDEWSKKQKEKIQGYSIRLIAVILWGLEPIFIKYTLTNTIDPMLRVPLKAIGGLITSIFFILFVYKSIQRRKIKITLPWNKIFALIVVGEALFSYMMNSSLIYTSGTNVILLNNFAPVISLIIAAVLWRDQIPYLKEKSNALAIFATFVIGSLGSTLLFYNDIRYSDATSITGNILATLNMLSDVVLVIALIQYIKNCKIKDTAILTFNIFIPILLISLPLTLFSSQKFSELSLGQIGYAIGAGILSGFAHILTMEAFKRIDGFLAYLMFNISIFVTFTMEAFILKEIPPTLILTIGGLMIMSASIIAEYINTQAEKKTMVTTQKFS
ncbi:HD domain-containing protein [Candidatus Peregrinibacteria bacterium]|nr:HD domain-containing protein [Candidatus Peregrinibacteria bacterium]